MLKKRLLSLLILCLFVLAAIPNVEAQETAPVTVEIISISGFPEVEVKFRVLDEAGNFVSGLTATDIVVTENTETVSINGDVSTTSGGVRGLFVVDAGLRLSQNNRWERTKEGIQYYLERKFSADDTVAVMAIEGTDPAYFLSSNYETDVDALMANLNQFTPPCNSEECTSNAISGLEQLFNLFGGPGDEITPAFVVFITGQLEQGANEQRINNIINNAQRLNIPIYPVYLPGFDMHSGLPTIAEGSGGLLVTYANQSSWEEVYRVIDNQVRQQYVLTYESLTLGSRDITVTVDNVFDTFQYEVNIAAPIITIKSPESGSKISPTDTQTIEVLADIGEYPRGITAFEITIEETGESVPATPDKLEGNRYEVTIPWEKFPQEDGNYTILIMATDEYNLTSELAEVSLTVSNITDLPTPEGTDTVPEQPADFSNNTLLAIALIVVAVLLLAGLFFFREKGPVKVARETIMRGVDRMTRRYSRQTEARGYLLVMEGDASQGKRLELFGTTTIGRSKQDSELLFQLYDESSPISRRHCTIIDEEDHFEIRDEDSANGTYLNGVRLSAMVPRELLDGDEIELARVERGGVKLQFLAVQNDPYDDFGSTNVSNATRMTRVVDRESGMDIEDNSGDRF
ncbi:MAG: FHA domain-containing protein [Anaerolineales bacterium]|nr:FHA domain-containing protein [Anaerolineales bacterium]